MSRRIVTAQSRPSHCAFKPSTLIPHRTPFKMRASTCAIFLTIGSGMLAGAGWSSNAHAQTAFSASAMRRYDIPAGPLSNVLTTFSGETGAYVVGASAEAQGKMSPGVQGTYSIDGALQTLLAGTGVRAVRLADGSYSLQPALGNTKDAALDTVALPAVTVLGTVDNPKDPVAQALNPNTSVGSKTGASQREIAQSVTVMSHEQIQQQSFQTLDDAMKYVPGVQALYTTSDRVQYYSRGFPINSYQIDGLPVYTNSNVSGTANGQAPSLAMYDRVEVLTGTAGLFAGLADAGGVINLIRKRAPNTFSADGQIQGGTYNNRSMELDVGGPLNKAGTVRGLIVGSYQNQDLSQNSTWQRNNQIYGTIEADLTAHTLLRIGGSYSQQVQHSSWANGPVAFTDGTFYIPPRSQYFGADWNRDVMSNKDVFLELQHTFSNGWLLRGAADYSTSKYSYMTSYLQDSVDPTTLAGTLTALDSQTTENTRNFEVFASGPVTLFGRSHDVTVGANYMQMNLHTRAEYSTPPSVNPFFIDVDSIFNTNIPMPVWTGDPDNTDASNEYAKQYGVYGNVRLHLADPLTMILGARVSWYDDRNVVDPVYNADAYTSATLGTYRHRVTPYLGMIYDIDKHHSIYFSYTSIFTPQFGATTSAGTGLKPIIGDQYELGVKGEYFKGRLNASAALFQATQENTAITDPDDNAYSIASGKVRDRGIEFKISGRVLPGWDVFAGYTYNLAKYLTAAQQANATGTPASSPLYQVVPRSQFTLWTNYRLPGNFSKVQVGAGIVATSTTRATNNYVQGSYYTADARVAYQLNKKDSIALNVTNLFNRDYYANALYRGRPRVLLVTLRAGF